MSDRVEGRASGEARVYQASGDQHIVEHHHHGAAPRDRAAAGPDSVRRPLVGRPPVVLRDREEVMTSLRAAVAPDTTGGVYVLHGMGGCGKTAIAHALFEHATGVAGRVGLWVDAADRSSLRAGMLAVAADRGAGAGELQAAREGLRAAADLVWDRLDGSDQPWLLVLDNADDPAILGEGGWLRPSPRGVVLVTTRQSAARWWPDAELRHVDVLPRREAARLLVDLAPDTGSVAEATEIADRLGDLPLALTLAGGFLSSQVLRRWTMAEYGQRLAGAERVTLLDRGAQAPGARHLVSGTWRISLDALAARGNSEAATLLRLMARFDAQPLPLEVLANREAVETVVPFDRLDAALRGLLDHSLTGLVEDEDGGGRALQTHAVLLDSVAAATSDNEAVVLDGVAGRLLDVLVPEMPDRGPRDPALRPLAPHLLAVLRRIRERGPDSVAAAETAAAVASTAVRLAIALHRTGDYLSGYELATAVVDVATPLLGPDHRTILAARIRVGRGLSRLGQNGVSASLLRDIFARCESIFGLDDPATLEARHQLSISLHNYDQEAGSLLSRRNRDEHLRVYGEEHPLSLRAQSWFLESATLADLQGQFQAPAESLPEKCARHLGEGHVITLGARHNYAYALYRLSRFDEGYAAYQGLYEKYVRKYGSDYPVTIQLLALEGYLLDGLGRHAEAVQTMERVVSDQINRIGLEHPVTQMNRGYLAEFRARAAAARGEV